MKAQTYRKRIVEDMKKTGTYRKEFGRVIDNLARLFEDMDRAREKFEDTGGELVVNYTNKNGSTNLVKNPLYLTIEGLQTNILLYSRELGLTPAGLRKITGVDIRQQEKEESPFAAFLKSQKSG